MSLSSVLTKHCPKFETSIPSTGNRVWFRPFLVKEEKKLLTIQEFGTDAEIVNCILEILESCFDSNIIRSLPTFDIEYLFLKLRTKSIGSVVTPTIICPYTGETIKTSIDLDEIIISFDPSHTKSLDLGNNIILTMKHPTMEMFMHTNHENSIYDVALSCIDTIQTTDELIEGSTQSKAELEDFLNSMSSSQFKQITHFFETVPKMEKVVTYTTSDKTERSIVLRGIKDFFR